MDNKTLRNPNNSLEQPETAQNNLFCHADLRKGGKSISSRDTESPRPKPREPER